MKHHASQKYWKYFYTLTEEIQELARKNFKLLKNNPRHHSLKFKKINKFWSVRVGLGHRAVGIDTPDENGIIWFWIGDHDEYERIIKSF